ncbi:MAG: hypothetical protein DRP09_19080, partial [Candidatus Thorarchaeota archaeon]
MENFEPNPSPLSASDGWLNRTITNSEWCAAESKYYLGNHSWYSKTTGDQYIKDNSSAIRNFTLMGSLTNTITKLIGQNVSREFNTSVIIQGYVKDDCGNTSTTATVYFNLTHNSYTHKCTGTVSGSNYECNWQPLSLGSPLGWYNITMFSNKSIHWDGLTTETYAFYYATVPDVNASTTAYPESPWGKSPFNFTSYITDQDNDTVTIRFWLKKGAEQWDNEYTDQQSHTNNNLSYYNRSFICSEPTNDVGTWYFKVNVTDTSGYGNTTSTIEFNITKEPLWIMHFLGNGTTLNRSETQPDTQTRLAVRLYDYIRDLNTTDPDETNVDFWINGTNVGSTLNSSGKNYYHDFNPTCDYPAGWNQWKVNFSGESCYADNESINFEVLVMGTLNATLKIPDGNTNFTEDSIISFGVNLTDDCNQTVLNANVWFNITNNRTGQSYRCPSSGYAEFNGTHYNCSISAQGMDSGWFDVKVNATKQYHWSDYREYKKLFFLVKPVKLTNPQLSYPGDGSWGEVHNFSVIVDHYASVQVCLLEKYSAGGSYNITECRNVPDPSNTLVNFTRTYTCGEQSSLLYWKINASEPGIPETYANTSEYNHYVEKDDITISYFFGNESEVNRSSGKTPLILYVFDEDRNVSAAHQPAYESPKIRFNVHNGTEFIEDGFNYTNSSGYVTYYFNPDCRYTVGKHLWYGRTYLDSCYKDAQSGQYNTTIYGDIAPNITYPNGETFQRLNTLIVNITAEIVDECNLQHLNATVNFTMISAAFGNHYPCQSIDDYQNGTQICRFNATYASEGYYDVNISAWGVDKYNKGYQRKNDSFRVIQTWVPPVLENETVMPEDDGGW